ncbi:MAG: hypothetical protein H6833_00180 [Planctomycetes bacterium]|nr:hypothetical protein [Planctomycetota bacterium]
MPVDPDPTTRESSYHEAREALDACLVALSDFVRVDRVLSGQLQAGRIAFFGTAVPESVSPAQMTRFLEWFILERHVDGTTGPPVRAFLAAGCPGLEAPGTRDFVVALAESEVGVWAIRDESDEGLELEAAFATDFVTRMLWPPNVPEPGTSVAPGMTVIGRLAQLPESFRRGGTDCWITLDGTRVFSGTTLFEAIENDVARHRLETGHDPIARGLELEPILVSHEQAAGETPDAVEAELAAFLGDVLEAAQMGESRGGTNASEAPLPTLEELFAALAHAPSPGPVIGPVLEALAFRTEVDLGTAQRLLLRLWNANQAAAQSATIDGPSARDSLDEASVAPQRDADRATRDEVLGSASRTTLGKRVLEELERGQRDGVPVEALFDRLESMVDAAAGQNLESDEVPEELRWHTEDQGDLADFATEYLWERAQGDHPASTEHAAALNGCIDDLARLDIRSVDALRRTHLESSFVEPWARGESRACVERVEALCAFHEWLVAVQEIEFVFDPSELRDALRAAVERCASLERALSHGEATGDSPRSFHVVAFENGAWMLASSTRRLAIADPERARFPFEVGDLVLGIPLAEAFATGVRVLPTFLAAVTRA